MHEWGTTVVFEKQQPAQPACLEKTNISTTRETKDNCVIVIGLRTEGWFLVGDLCKNKFIPKVPSSRILASSVQKIWVETKLTLRWALNRFPLKFTQSANVIQVRKQRLNLNRSWYKDHSRAYNTSFYSKSYTKDLSFQIFRRAFTVRQLPFFGWKLDRAFV